MDAIRKKMQSLRLEQDQLNATIAKYEEETKAANALNDQYECDIRDLGKKIQANEKTSQTRASNTVKHWEY